MVKHLKSLYRLESTCKHSSGVYNVDSQQVSVLLFSNGINITDPGIEAHGKWPPQLPFPNLTEAVPISLSVR